MPRYGSRISRRINSLKAPSSVISAEAPGSASPSTSIGQQSSDLAMTEDDLGIVHHIPAPRNKQRSKRVSYSVGQTFNHRRVAGAVYGGVRTYTTSSTAQKSKNLSDRIIVPTSPGHSSAVSTPNNPRMVEFEPIEEEDEDGEFEDEEWSPAMLLGKGYSAPLPKDPSETNHHQKWRRITSDRWLSLLPTLVMPYLDWCRITGYGRTRPAPCQPQPCTCGQNKRSTRVQMIYSQCQC